MLGHIHFEQSRQNWLNLLALIRANPFQCDWRVGKIYLFMLNSGDLLLAHTVLTKIDAVYKNDKQILLLFCSCSYTPPLLILLLRLLPLMLFLFFMTLFPFF
jgi:hypothetical protein